MEKIAAVDLGTNTFLCLIAEVEKNDLRVIEDVARVVRLGEKVNTNNFFLPEALTRAKVCLEEFSHIIKKHHVDHVVATATSAARDATNGKELLDLGREYNIPISIIEGAQEARLSFEGAVSGLDHSKDQNILVVDVGGGSTELIFRRRGENKIKGQSFDVGCVRLTEMFLKEDPVNPDEYKNLFDYGSKVLKQYGDVTPDIIIAVAGTPTTLACVAQNIEFDENKVEGYKLTRAKLKELVKILGEKTLEERKHIKGLHPLRADVIVAGGALLLAALDLTNEDAIQVSTRGLRFGAALNYKGLI